MPHLVGGSNLFCHRLELIERGTGSYVRLTTTFRVSPRW